MNFQNTQFQLSFFNYMKNLAFVIITVISFALNAFATGQAPDVLIYDGKIYNLFSNPLEDFYKNEKDRPQFLITPGGTSSGNWRGYVGFWEISEDSLYLKGLDSWLCEGSAVEKATGKAGCSRVDIKNLFGSKFSQNRVSADWFTGELRIPDGKQIQYVHMGYGSIYEKDIVISVSKGKITGKMIIDNTKKEPKSELELQRKELEKLKKSRLGNKKIN